MATVITCEFDKCDWKSPPGPLDPVVKLLEIHVSAKHAPGQRIVSTKTKKAKRQEIAVNRVKLQTLKQDKGELIRKFCGRIHSLATAAEYTVSCDVCSSEVSYTEKVIKDQVIAGIEDPKIQKDVISNGNGKDSTLENLLCFVEGKESVHTSLKKSTQ